MEPLNLGSAIPRSSTTQCNICYASVGFWDIVFCRRTVLVSMGSKRPCASLGGGDGVFQVIRARGQGLESEVHRLRK